MKTLLKTIAFCCALAIGATGAASDVLAGPGGDLIDAGRQRMRPWTVVDLGASVDLVRGRRGRLALRAQRTG